MTAFPEGYDAFDTPADADLLGGSRPGATGVKQRKITLSALWAFMRAKLTTTPVTIAEGGTGAATAAAARTALEVSSTEETAVLLSGKVPVPEIKTESFTAEVGKTYVIDGSIGSVTVSDPASPVPAEGEFYTVIKESGTLIIGGSPVTGNGYVIRMNTGGVGSWTTKKIIEKDTTDSLQTQIDTKASTADLAAETAAREAADALLTPMSEQSDQLVLQGVAYSRLQKFRAALAVRRAGGTGPVRVLVPGDSTSSGYGAVGATYAGAKAKSFPRYLASILTSTGLPADEGAWIGTGCDETQAGGTLDAYDPRVTLGAGWASTATSPTLGRRYIRNNSTTNALSFAPGISFDRIEIYYTSSGSITVDIGGGTLATGLASVPLTRLAVSCIEGVNTVNITRVGSDIFILGVICYSSTSGAVSVVNAGNPGATSATVAATGDYGSLSAVRAIAPALSIISLGINDISAARTAEQYKASMATLIDACQESGDVVLVSFVPFNGANYASLAPGYVDALRELASEKNCILIDHTARFGSYASANALGYYFDNVHLVAGGYYEVAQSLANTLRRFF